MGNIHRRQKKKLFDLEARGKFQYLPMRLNIQFHIGSSHDRREFILRKDNKGNLRGRDERGDRENLRESVVNWVGED